MPAPTLDEVLALLNKKEVSASPNKWFDGNEWHTGKPRNSGSFQGRAGSIRRTSKGRTRRMPNGTRKFIVDSGHTNVVAYIGKP